MLRMRYRQVMRTRLADIAIQAGVSEATVSRVLNDKPGVAAETRQAVLTALDVLGYERPARLRKHSAGLVGLVVPELENPIFPMFAQVVESVLAQHGYTPVLCTHTWGGVTEDEYVEMLLERSVAGIIFVSGLHADTTADPARYHRLVARRLPIVLVNGYLEGLEAPFISPDEVVAADLAVTHLASLGHRRIGLISGPQRFMPVQRKLTGYRAAMGRLTGATDAELDELVSLSLWFSVEGGMAAASRLLDRGVTGFVCGSDLMALGAIRAARQRGLAVPRDVSVVGYDDSPLIAFTDPPLTTVRQPVLAMASAAVSALLDQISGRGVTASEFLFAPELVVRASTAAAPAQPGREPAGQPAERPFDRPPERPRDALAGTVHS